MLTFTQRKNMAAKLCGINYTEPEMDIIETNLNMGDKLLENAARRMWTRKEKTNIRDFLMAKFSFATKRSTKDLNDLIVLKLRKDHLPIVWSKYYQCYQG